MRSIRLHQHLQDAALTVEIVGVCRTEVDRQSVVHVGHRQAHRARLDAIHLDMQLRRRGLVFGSDVGKQRALRCHPKQLVARIGQRFTAHAAAILQFHGEPAGLAQRLDRGWLDRECQRIVEPHEGAHCLAHQRLGGTVRRAAFTPIGQRGEHDCIVLALTEETEAAHHDYAFDFLARLPEPFDGFDRLVEPLLRRSCRRLNDGDYIALVLGRQEPAGQARKQQPGNCTEQQEDRQSAHRPGEDFLVRAPVFFRHLREPLVEAVEEYGALAPRQFDLSAPAFGQRGLVRLAVCVAVMVLHVLRAQEGRTERWCQRQREHGREEDRYRESDGELAVDATGRSGEERHRYEDRDEHQSDTDDRPGDLIHRLARRGERAKPFLAHDALDILDHHDGVIDQNADRQHHAE